MNKKHLLQAACIVYGVLTLGIALMIPTLKVSWDAPKIALMCTMIAAGVAATSLLFFALWEQRKK